MQIKGQNYEGVDMVLRFESGKRVEIGDVVNMRDGDTATVTGGSAPHKPGSTGRIYVRMSGVSTEMPFFPSVCGARWVPENDK